MKSEWVTVIIITYGFVWLTLNGIVMPLLNIYMEYRKEIRMHEQDMAMYRVQLNEKGGVQGIERLQRDNDFADIKQRSGKSDEGTSLHDEELPL
jgi:hypothetical protein